MGLKSHHKKIVKIGVSLILLGYLVYLTPFEEVVGLYGTINLWGLLGIYLLFVFLNNAVCPFRWKLILQAQGRPMPLRPLMRTYAEAMFFSMFTPGGIGGDIYRIKRVIDLGGTGTVGTASVLFDRYTGFVALLLVGIFGSIIYSSQFSWGKHVLSIYVVLLALSFSPLVLFHKSVRRKKWNITRIKYVSRIEQQVNDLYDAVKSCFASRRTFSVVVIISIAYQAGAVFAVYLLGNLMGSGVSFGGFLLIVPLVLVLTMLPISFGGLGIREASFMYFLFSMGDAQSIGLGLSLMIYFLTFLSSVLGSGLYMLRG